ncbi:hypothetical protein MMC13_002819 [Lambiella insularis]|nr:hypothetical protein [Lambiella insularis]
MVNFQVSVAVLSFLAVAGNSVSAQGLRYGSDLSSRSIPGVELYERELDFPQFETRDLYDTDLWERDADEFLGQDLYARDFDFDDSLTLVRRVAGFWARCGAAACYALTGNPSKVLAHVSKENWAKAGVVCGKDGEKCSSGPTVNIVNNKVIQTAFVISGSPGSTGGPAAKGDQDQEGKDDIAKTGGNGKSPKKGKRNVLAGELMELKAKRSYLEARAIDTNRLAARDFAEAAVLARREADTEDALLWL